MVSSYTDTNADTYSNGNDGQYKSNDRNNEPFLGQAKKISLLLLGFGMSISRILLGLVEAARSGLGD